VKNSSVGVEAIKIFRRRAIDPVIERSLTFAVVFANRPGMLVARR